MKIIDGKYHTDGEQIIKTSNGQAIPDDEPMILFRGRDRLALPTLEYYKHLCYLDGCNEYQMTALQKVIDKFNDFYKTSPTMKQPGITEGK